MTATPSSIELPLSSIELPSSFELPSSVELPAAPPSLPSPPGRSVVEVRLPLKASHKWVAYACRTAGVGKPKWDALRDVWTCTFQASDGVEERITITGSGEMSIRVRVDWNPDVKHHHTSTGRRIVSAIMMAMQAQVRQRSSGLLMVAPRIPFPDER